MRFPANSSHVCFVELALDRLLFGSKRFLRRRFSLLINSTAVPRWWAPIRAKKVSVLHANYVSTFREKTLG